MAVNEINR